MRDTPLERAPLAPTRPKPQVRMTRRLAGFDALEATAAAAFQGSINSGLLLALDAVGRNIGST